MNEDQDRTRLDNGPHNLAVLRHMALNVMQKDTTKGSLRGKFMRAGWDDRYLARLWHYSEMRLPWPIANLVAGQPSFPCLPLDARPEAGYCRRYARLFYDLEERLLRQDVRCSPGEVEALLAPDFFEFGRSGLVWNRQQTIDGLANEPAADGSVTDFDARALSETVVLVTYRSTRRDPGSRREWHSLRSSIWKLTDGRWQMAFHQGTPTRRNL